MVGGTREEHNTSVYMLSVPLNDCGTAKAVSGGAPFWAAFSDIFTASPLGVPSTTSPRLGEGLGMVGGTREEHNTSLYMLSVPLNDCGTAKAVEGGGANASGLPRNQSVNWLSSRDGGVPFGEELQASYFLINQSLHYPSIFARNAIVPIRSRTLVKAAGSTAAVYFSSLIKGVTKMVDLVKGVTKVEGITAWPALGSLVTKNSSLVSIFGNSPGKRSPIWEQPLEALSVVKAVGSTALLSTIFSEMGLGEMKYTKGGKMLSLLLLSLLASPASATPVCLNCQGWIEGCPGAADRTTCVLLVGVTANLAAVAQSAITSLPSLTVGGIGLVPPEMLSTFNKPVVECIVGAACGPAMGRTIDFTAAPYSTSTHAVVQAAIHGHCAAEEASLVLSERLEAAATELEVTKIKTAIDMLKSRLETSVSTSSSGVYAYVWAKVGEYLETVKKGVARISSGSVKTVASELTAKIRRPADEWEFMEMLHYWHQLVISLGLAVALVVYPFITDVVYYTRTRLRESWQVAHELMLIKWRAIALDSTGKTTLGTVMRCTPVDVDLAEAKLNAATFFRTRGANPRADGGTSSDGTKSGGGAGRASPVTGTKEWNGKSTPTATRCCMAFNLQESHKTASLDSSGCCKYAHRCDQWVTDKGPRGQCGGNHPRKQCTYPEDKRCADAHKE